MYRITESIVKPTVTEDGWWIGSPELVGTFAGRNKPPSEGMDSQDLEAVKGSAIVRVWRREVRFESISMGAYSDMDAEP